MENILDEVVFAPDLARRRDRVFAGLIDFGIPFLVSIVLLVLYGTRVESFDGGIRYELKGSLNSLPVVVWFLFGPLLEAVRGQSLGKSILKLKVISNDFSNASFGQVIARHLFDIIDWAPGFGIVGLLVASNNLNRQRVGDLVAKTIVIRQPLIK